MKKIVAFQPPEEEEFLFISTTKKLRPPVISTMKAKRLLDSGYVGYLASVVDTSLEQHSKPEDVPVVQEFLEVFQEDKLSRSGIELHKIVIKESINQTKTFQQV